MEKSTFNLANVGVAVLEVLKSLKCSYVLDGDTTQGTPSESELDLALHRGLTNVISQVKAYEAVGVLPETVFSVEKVGNNVIFMTYIPRTQHLQFFKIEGKTSIFESQASFKMEKDAEDVGGSVMLSK